MKRFVLLIGMVLMLLAYPANASHDQGNDKSALETPEKTGDYQDPDHKDIRVRVFVHSPKVKNEPVQTQACVDPTSNAIVHAAGWKLPGSWTYNLNSSNTPSSIGSASFATITTNSFNTWQSSQGSVAFSRGSDSSKTKNSYDGVNLVAFGRTSGNTLGVTYVRYYTATGQAVDIDTILNQRMPWNWSACGNSNSYDVQNILTHEIGHTMGLDDEYTTSYIDNTMYGYGSKNETKKNTLTTGDIDGVKAIYP